LTIALDHAEVLAMPGWTQVVEAAQKTLSVLLDGDTTLGDLDEQERGKGHR
jgi:hypothetical protein